MQKFAVDIGETLLGPGTHFSKEPLLLRKFTSSAVSLGLTIATIIFMFLLLFGGIGMIAGAGSNNPERAAKGKQSATAAVVGFIVVFAAYWIVQLIQVITGLELL